MKTPASIAAMTPADLTLRPKPYKVVDVFTSEPLLGNPVAVVFDADDLTSKQMQAIARWTNLSETTFLLSPTTPAADYRLRIFTPRGELPFAGHPTLGSAHAVLDAGRCVAREGQLIQECASGLIPISVEQSSGRQSLKLEMPPAKVRDLSDDEISDLERALGSSIDHQARPAVVDVGATWIVARLASAEAVLALTPDLRRCAAFDSQFAATGVAVFGPHKEGHAAIEVRAFAPSHGIDEDPVCGSGNGSVAFFQHHRGILLHPSYIASQGQCVGRRGQVSLQIDTNGKIHVGGNSITCVDGVLNV